MTDEIWTTRQDTPPKTTTITFYQADGGNWVTCACKTSVSGRQVTKHMMEVEPCPDCKGEGRFPKPKYALNDYHICENCKDGWVIA